MITADRHQRKVHIAYASPQHKFKPEKRAAVVKRAMRGPTAAPGRALADSVFVEEFVYCDEEASRVLKLRHMGTTVEHS